MEVSLRESRREGDLDLDPEPEVGDIVQGFVIDTNKKGCFMRLARHIEGRATLKELADGFLPDPAASFPTGRLVAAKVKAKTTVRKNSQRKLLVDLDLRESSLAGGANKNIGFDEIEIGGKYRATVSRIEDYGVFVRIENSALSGLAHKSECSDSFVKNLASMYTPGDVVKVVCLKKDEEKRNVGFGLKPSYFNDEDSDAMESDSDSDVEMDEENGLQSDDENFVAKLAADVGNESSSRESVESDDDSNEAESDDDAIENKETSHEPMETDVGFDWDGDQVKREVSDDEESDDSLSSDDEGEQKSSHKSRRKQAQRRREEEEISRREQALADGTADDNPETPADFERLLASSPNSSETWIRYMAFHLTLADVSAARKVAERAFERIEFREEREKLNVWCALLKLEQKYGTRGTFDEAVARACQHNNPKQVYLRVGEMLASDSVEQANEHFEKMCSKFRGKKQAWLAYMSFLLQNNRSSEALIVSKRAMKSLPKYKHLETMSRFAQLVYEYGSTEQARTLFDGLLNKYPKRLDLLNVYIDKEVKHGDWSHARELCRQVAEGLKGLKLSDKQMKSVFQKWFGLEEQYGDEESQEAVKDAARAYVDRS